MKIPEGRDELGNIKMRRGVKKKKKENRGWEEREILRAKWNKDRKKDKIICLFFGSLGNISAKRMNEENGERNNNCKKETKEKQRKQKGSWEEG